jgi:DNA mismatch repair protein MSH4
MLTSYQFPPFSELAMSEARVSNPAKHAASRVSQLLQLQGILRTLPALQRALNGSRSQLLQVIHDVRVRYYVILRKR